MQDSCIAVVLAGISRPNILAGYPAFNAMVQMEKKNAKRMDKPVERPY